MAKLTTLETLSQLEREMAAEGRTVEVEALRDAAACVSRTLTHIDEQALTTGAAAAKLGVSVSTVKRWVERGVLKGVDTGTRWLVARESVERILRLRRTLDAIDEQGNPTTEELVELRRRGRRTGVEAVDEVDS